MGAMHVIAVPASGCGGLSSTGSPPVSDAVSQVKEDGFSVDVTGAEHRPGTRPEFDTYLASGRLLLGLSHGERKAALTERDLHRLAGEIGS